MRLEVGDDHWGKSQHWLVTAAGTAITTGYLKYICWSWPFTAGSGSVVTTGRPLTPSLAVTTGNEGGLDIRTASI